MTEKFRIGIVGAGFVGTAVQAGFNKPRNELFVVDPKLGTTLEWMIEKDPEVVFICVPTPMGENGEIDSSIVESVISKLVDYDGLVVLKSTVTPTKIQKLEKMHPRFVYNPEFLTEANAVRDFLDPFMHVFGGDPDDVDELDNIYVGNSNCKVSGVSVYKCTPVEASLVKYGINNFLALKVAFANQWKDLCGSVYADYDVVKKAIGTDPRIGNSHMSVPGPDGRRGYSGSCFPKDCPAIINESIALGAELTISRAAWNANCEYRSDGVRLPREIEQHIKFNKI